MLVSLRVSVAVVSEEAAGSAVARVRLARLKALWVRPVRLPQVRNHDSWATWILYTPQDAVRCD